MSALWLPITVLGTWLLAGEVLGRRRLLQTAAAAVPALVPMVAFVSSSVSPDGMLFAHLDAGALARRPLRQTRRPVRDGAAFLAVVAVACTVKPTSYALLPAAALVVVLGAASPAGPGRSRDEWRWRGNGGRGNRGDRRRGGVHRRDSGDRHDRGA